MMHFYVCHGELLRQVPEESGDSAMADAVWIDLLEPTQEEERAIETALGIELPTREEMSAIEASSRVYEENNALYMNVNLLARAAERRPEVSSATFVLTQTKLVTIRYANPKPFETFLDHSQRSSGQFGTGAAVCAGLMEAIVDRVADILEMVGADIDVLSKDVFSPSGQEMQRPRDYRGVLYRIGQNEDLASKARDSLTTIARVTVYLTKEAKARHNEELQERFDRLHEDIASLNDYLGFMSGKLSFALDATLGMISIEQNQIIKVFTVFIVMTTPPIVIAGIYGMNFKHMPELDWWWGYPLALVVMVVSAVLPYLWIRARRWL